jgi:hypothetical protein
VPAEAAKRPEELLPLLRDVLETNRLDLEEGALAEQLAGWMKDEHPNIDIKNYGFQEFAEFLNFAQDKTVVRIEPDEEKGLMVYLGAEFYPPAPPPKEELAMPEEDIDEPQPNVLGQPTIFEPNPPPPPVVLTTKPKRARPPKKRTDGNNMSDRPVRPRRTPPRKKTPA